MTKEEIKDELYRMLSDVVNGGYPKRSNTQRGRYREAVKKAIEVLEQEPELRQALEMEKGAYNALVKDLQCSDCISRQAAIDACLNGWNKDYKEIVEEIRALPPVKPVEKVGHWIMHIDDLFPAESTMECNKCHEHQPITIDDNYCPSCGAKMQEVK